MFGFQLGVVRIIRIGLILLAGAAVSLGATLRAGGGPENIILVVNQNSPASMQIANLYIELRKIHPANVVYVNLPGPPDRESIPLDMFRDIVLRPVFQAIEDRKLSAQIDYIIYSADVPTSINVADELEELKKQSPQAAQNPKLFNPKASINAMTFFAGSIMGKSPAFFELDANWYMRRDIASALSNPFLGEEQSKYQAAMDALQAGRYDDAEQQLGQLAQVHPFQFAVRLAQVRCYAGLDKPELAALALIELKKTGWDHRESILAFPEVKRIADDAGFARALQSQATGEPPYLNSHAFYRRISWAPNGGVNSTPDQSRQFILSTVLAVTRNRGTTVEEAMAQIRRSVAADYTRPPGVFYFTDTKDIRTRTRKPGFEAAIQGLRNLSLQSQIVEANLPQRQHQVLGVLTGIAQFDWPASQSQLMPGAIADNLTSYGGLMKGSTSQTAMTEFLRDGAAGSSGTVCEPFALQAKFAHPMIFVHYARGCNLAEAYYQSVQGPFQLLIVGDALCQPWARPVQFTCDPLPEPVRGKVSIKVHCVEEDRIGRIEVFLDGVRVQSDRQQNELEIDTTALPDGYHDLRLVVISKDWIGTQSRQILPLIVDNHGGRLGFSADAAQAKFGADLPVTVSPSRSSDVLIYHNGRVVAKVAAGSEHGSVATKKLGAGNCQLIAVVKDGDEYIRSQPVMVEIL